MDDEVTNILSKLTLDEDDEEDKAQEEKVKPLNDLSFRLNLLNQKRIFLFPQEFMQRK